jgi:MFS family permease
VGDGAPAFTAGAPVSPTAPIARGLIAATALAAALSPLNSTMLSVAVGPIGKSLATDDATVTRALVTSYLVTSIVMQAPGGKLGDRLGHRRAVAIGQLAFALGSVLAAVSPSLAGLVVARVAMASAGAMIVPSATALLRTELPAHVRGRAFGVFGAVMALAAAIGPPLGGQLGAWFGWRSIFAVNLVLLPISAWLAGRPSQPTHAATPARAPTPGARFDLRGAVLFGVALASLVLGVGRGGALNLPLLALSAAALVAFVWVERRHPSPVVELSLLRLRPFVAGGLLIALHNLVMYSLLFELPSVVSVVLHGDVARGGRLLLAMIAPIVVAGPLAGRLGDAYGARAVAVSGALLGTAGIIALRLTPLRTVSSPIPALLLLGLGLGLASAPSQAAAMSAVPADQSAVGAGMLATMRYLGGVFGTLLLGVVLAGAREERAVLAGHGNALVCFLVATIAAIGCALALPARITREAHASAGAGRARTG